MDQRVARKVVDQFRSPRRTLGDLEADEAAKVIAAASDVALVLDSKGVVRDVAFGSDDLSREGYSEWVGQRWIETVTVESRPKVEELLRDAASAATPRWRQVNHPSARGVDVPIRYSAVQVGPSGRVVVIGRDLRTVASLQQRLMEAQQSMEREYARLRHAETRYRLLFQIASEAVLIVEAGTGRIVEVNPAASRLIGKSVKKLSGRPFVDVFSSDSQKKVEAHLSAVRKAGRADEVKARFDDSKLEIRMEASLFRQESGALFLVRLAPAEAERMWTPRSNSSLMDVVQQLPDGFLVTDEEQRILVANTAFLDLVQIATEDQVRGEPVDRWLGRHAVDVNVLMRNLRDNGHVRNFATVVRGEYGSTEDVEISAVSVTSSDTPCFGITIRVVGRRVEPVINGRRALPRSVEQLTELVGRVSLKDLVRESTDMIERLCIEAALELTGDNRASAAEMLGLSRQGLYSKLRRHGLGDLDSASGG
ncbi:MAG: transcriptional regulator PpsR [Hyphomicrobium sp.]